MVPLLSLLLHLCHKYSHYYKLEGSTETCRIPFASESEDGAASAFTALENSGDMAVIDGSNSGDAWTLRQVFLDINTNLMNSVKSLELSKGAITGLEIMDMIRKPGQGSTPREVNPHPRSWLYLAGKADVICTCSKLGPAIEPVPALTADILSSRPTCGCCARPSGSYYLVSHMKCLSLLLEQFGKSLGDLQNGEDRFGAPGLRIIQSWPHAECDHPPQSHVASDAKRIVQKISRVVLKEGKEQRAMVVCEIPSNAGVVVFKTFQPAFAAPPSHRFKLS